MPSHQLVLFAIVVLCVITIVTSRGIMPAAQSNMQAQMTAGNKLETIIENATSSICSSNPDCVAVRAQNEAVLAEEIDFDGNCIKKGLEIANGDQIGNLCSLMSCVDLSHNHQPFWQDQLMKLMQSCIVRLTQQQIE